MTSISLEDPVVKMRLAVKEAQQSALLCLSEFSDDIERTKCRIAACGLRYVQLNHKFQNLHSSNKLLGQEIQILKKTGEFLELRLKNTPLESPAYPLVHQGCVLPSSSRFPIQEINSFANFVLTYEREIHRKRSSIFKEADNLAILRIIKAPKEDPRRIRKIELQRWQEPLVQADAVLARKREELVIGFLKTAMAHRPSSLNSVFKRIEKIWEETRHEAIPHPEFGQRCLSSDSACDPIVAQAIAEEIRAILVESTLFSLSNYFKHNDKRWLRQAAELYAQLPPYICRHIEKNIEKNLAQKGEKIVEQVFEGFLPQKTVDCILEYAGLNFKALEHESRRLQCGPSLTWNFAVARGKEYLKRGFEQQDPLESRIVAPAFIEYLSSGSFQQPPARVLCDESLRGSGYTVKDKEGRTRAFIVGTIHDVPFQALRLSKRIQRAFFQANALMLERYADSVLESQGNPNYRGCPVTVSPSIQMKIGDMDGWFRRRAYDAGKALLSLEDTRTTGSPDPQWFKRDATPPFTDIPLRLAQNITLLQQEDPASSAAAVVEKEMIPILRPECLEDFNIYMENRNTEQRESLDAILQSTDLLPFVCTGLMHLPDCNNPHGFRHKGLITLMRDKGWIVEKMNDPLRDDHKTL